MARSKEMDLTTGNPFRSLLKFAIPVILGNLFQITAGECSAFLYTGGLCNRRKNAGSRFPGSSRFHQYYYLFCILFYQWIHRWIWYLSGTEMRGKG